MIDRRTFTATAVAGSAIALLGLSRKKVQAQTAITIRNVVLVHGAYADGSCWLEVIERLQQAGLRATAVQNSLTSLADDVAATRRILALHVSS
jgi:pimeloyl-ACP methyl ester carboxylesterase